MFCFLFKKKKAQPAEINQDLCDGCEQCSLDCPYEAIDMLVANGVKKAKIDPSKCESCGICVASCKGLSITMPSMPSIHSGWDKSSKQLAIFICRMAGNTARPENENFRCFTVECIGDVNAIEVDLLKIVSKE